MRACVIGTSNTIQRGGWFDGFCETFEGEVDRFALGGAPFIQFLGILRDLERNKYDFIIFDTAPNDDSFYESVGNEFVFDSCYFKFVSSLMSIAPTSMLYIPTERAYKNTSAVFERQNDICRSLGCEVINLTGLIEMHAQSLGVAHHRDLQHPSTVIMKEIGRHLGSKFSELEIRKSSSAVDYSHIFENVSLTSVVNETTTIKNSLVDEAFALLRLGQTARLRRPVTCLGFFVDASNSHGILRLSGDRGARDIFCFFDSEKNKLTKRFVPVSDGFEISSVSVVRHSKAAEFALHSSFAFQPPYHVALGSFLTYEKSLAPS